MNYLILIILLTSCQTTPRLRVLCRHIVLAQVAAAEEIYGKENVRTPDPLTLKVPGEFARHQQIQVRINGKWFWIDNEPLYYELRETCNPNCIEPVDFGDK